MARILGEIDYKLVFYYFEEISRIPRGSGHNEEIGRYLMGFGKEHGLECHQDKVGNVILIKEATPGYENAPAVILQGHMDMVCEKESGVEHDFLTEGLELNLVEGADPEESYVEAVGTTLGGDDGIAIAYALAIFAGEGFRHPRLEAVITVDEETGMDGAYGLDVTPLKGKYMINLDSEDEGVLLSSCAGGMGVQALIPAEWVDVEGVCVELRAEGLRGGHSGAEIHSNRTNANLLMARCLFDLKRSMEYHLVSVEGGRKGNAIPRESIARIVVDAGKAEELVSLLSELETCYKAELSAAEPDVRLGAVLASGEPAATKAMAPECAGRVLCQLLMAPNGVQAMSAHLPGLVESSLNLGILETGEDGVHFHYSIRSSVGSYKEHVAQKLVFFTEYLGGKAEAGGSYPAWEYKADSKLRSLMERVFEEQYGKAPAVEAIHAGLECGLITEKIPGIDIVALGPDMKDIHTPGERLYIESTKRVFDYLAAVLERFVELA